MQYTLEIGEIKGEKKKGVVREFEGLCKVNITEEQAKVFLKDYGMPEHLLDSFLANYTYDADSAKALTFNDHTAFRIYQIAEEGKIIKKPFDALQNLFTFIADEETED